MKIKFLTVIFFLLSTGLVLHAQLWLVDPLEAIYPDVNSLDNYNNKWKSDYAIGSIPSVHILFRIPKGQVYSVSVVRNNVELPNSLLNKLIDVPVEQNTGLDSRTEQYLGKSNPHVIRKAPFRIFEVIQPIGDDLLKSNSTFTALRLNIPASMTQETGVQKIKIKIEANDFKAEAVFTFNIHDVQLPKPENSEFFYTNWFSLPRMESQHKVERWSDLWFVMLKKYAKIMAHGRQNSITIPQELFKYENNKISLDRNRMLRFINVFRDQGFKYFEAPHLMNRGENDDWGDEELKVALTKRRYYKENGNKDVEVLMHLIYDFVKTNNLEDTWLQHISDEPTSVTAACYKDIANQIKEIYPEIKIMEATNDRDGLAGAVDIWCPLINDFQEHESFFREREKLGEKVLVYTCLIPGGKWLNRTLDMERLRQVYFGWGASHYNTNGYLHWGLNQYYGNPFNQSVVKHPSPQATANNFLPAGDTHIIYPGEKGPLSSIRFESHRIGIEDYDLLRMLKNKNPKKYKKLVNNLFRSYTDYNLSINDYRKIKKKLLSTLK
jgi:hypothetical protein